MDVHCSIICFTPCMGCALIFFRKSSFTDIQLCAVRCVEMMQTAETRDFCNETEIDQEWFSFFFKAAVFPAFLLKPRGWWWWEFPYIFQLLGLMFIDSMSEANGCVRAGAGLSVQQNEGSQDHWFHCICPDVRARRQGIMSRSREQGYWKH